MLGRRTQGYLGDWQNPTQVSGPIPQQNLPGASIGNDQNLQKGLIDFINVFKDEDNKLGY